MLPSSTDSKESLILSLPRKLLSGTINVLIMIGIVPAIAMMNIRDEETWKRGFVSVALGIVFCVASLPLLPFLVLGIGASMLEDRFLP